MDQVAGSGVPECEYLRVRLVHSSLDGPVIFDRRIDVWHRMPQKNFGLADGSEWVRTDFEMSGEDDDPAFVVVVARVTSGQ